MSSVTSRLMEQNLQKEDLFLISKILRSFPNKTMLEISNSLHTNMNPVLQLSSPSSFHSKVEQLLVKAPESSSQHGLIFPSPNPLSQSKLKASSLMLKLLKLSQILWYMVDQSTSISLSQPPRSIMSKSQDLLSQDMMVHFTTTS